MPSHKPHQIPAGVKKSCRCKPLGTRSMISRSMDIETSLEVGNTIYKGNAVLNANK